MRAPLTEATLITAVRTFDQGGVETFPGKLEQIWKILSQGTGNFHAAEEMLVRALLKNMNGTTPDAERLRRYPLTWSVLGAAFTRIPAFSLAKCLADRKFIGILHQTLREISRPEATSAKSESRKRKRVDPLTFDLPSQQQLSHCLQTSETVFQVLRSLLSRCKSSLDQTYTNSMGAEVIKALFFSSSSEVMDIVVPLLTTCSLALQSGDAQLYDDQMEWISTITFVWELHRQADDDSLEVATHLTTLGTTLLAKLTASVLEYDQSLKERWTRDLRRFLTRSLILPSRAAFFNRESLEAIQFAVEVSNFIAAVTCPVLFDLVLRAPTAIGGDQTTKRDNESWVQAVFDIIEPAVRELNTDKGSAMRAILDMAVKHKTPLNLRCLSQLCAHYALGEAKTDWKLLLCLVKLNPDVFLLPQDGKDLLEPVLLATTRLESSHSEFGCAVQFLTLLARGFAKARDLSGFLKKWYDYLALSEREPPSGISGEVWSHEQLVETVAEILQGSMNTKQLLDLLEWLGTQNDGAQTTPRMRILVAISRAISQEDFIDAVGTKLHDLASTTATPIADPHLHDTSELRYIIAERTISWSTVEQAEKIWKDLEVVGVTKAPVLLPSVLAAFKFVARAWVAQYPNGKYEVEAAAATCAFIERLEKKTPKDDVTPRSRNVHRETYLAWIFSDIPRVLSLYVRRSGQFPKFFLSLLMSEIPDARFALQANGGLNNLLLGYGGDTSNLPLIDKLLGQLTKIIKKEKDGLSSCSGQTAIHFLLDTPIDLINREQREAVMETLVSQVSKNKEISVRCWKPILSLMVKLMGRPTFYQGMCFNDLDNIAQSLPGITPKSKEDWSEDGLLGKQQLLRLFEELATITLRQMTSSVEQREKNYMQNAASVFQNFVNDGPGFNYAQLVLLKSAVAVLQDSPATKRLDIDLRALRTSLADQVLGNIQAVSLAWSKKSSKKEQKGANLFALLITIHAADILSTGSLVGIESHASQLVSTSDQLVGEGARAGWEIRTFLAKHCTKEMTTTLDIELPDLFVDRDEKAPQTLTMASGFPVVDQDTILDYVDTVIQNISEDARLEHLEKEVSRMKEVSNSLGQIIAINQLVQNTKDSRTLSAAGESAFDLAAVHTALCEKLLSCNTTAEFILAAETIQLLLDQRAMSMTQWNIELTLSTVSGICSDITARPPAAACPKSYNWFVLMVASIIKRHRKRLDGHFHLLITTLESLLQVLIRHPYDSTGHVKIAGPAKDTTSFPHWIGHAKQFTRLLTLVCEPSAASVSRSQPNALDSEKDKAKRYASQYMCQVLMRYVQLQLEHVVPHGVREALEPGVYSILVITTPGGLRIMSDAMDVSGRAVMKELYRQYQKFGKWTGI